MRQVEAHLYNSVQFLYCLTGLISDVFFRTYLLFNCWGVGGAVHYSKGSVPMPEGLLKTTPQLLFLKAAAKVKRAIYSLYW